jgi:nicotinamidase-related amidase
MLIEREKSCLLLIDLQDKLINAVYDYRRLLDHCEWLIGIAQQLNVPILASEQYPKGLGHTTEVLSKNLPHSAFMEKTSFSCMKNETCKTRIEELNKEHVIIAGIEAHVCVLQTALQLKASGKKVFVVRDAISSRNVDDRKAAISRMKMNGVQVVTHEMVAFEWLEEAGTPEFKAVCEVFLKH